MLTYKLIFIGLIAFINLMGLYYTLKAYEVKNGIALYTKIPYYLAEDEKIEEICQKGRKRVKLFTISTTLLFVILTFFFEPVSIMLINIIVMMLIPPFIFQKDIDEMRIYKQKNAKETTKKKIIDLDLIEQKDKFIVKKSFYLPLVLIYFIGIFIGVFYEVAFAKRVWILIGLAMMVGDIFLDRILMKSGIKTYTDDSEKNILLNEKIAKRQSKLLYRKSLINSILFLIFVILVKKDPFSMLGFFIYILGISIIYSYTFYKYNKLKNNPILNTISRDQYEDEIEYYNAWGYYNPNDTRLFVNKVYGVGSDINLGKLGGKIYYGFTVLLLVGLLFFTNWVFNTPTQYTYKMENETINITSSQFYKDQIKVKDIESIKLLDEFPKGRVIRTGGNAFEKTNTGNYRIENYGNVRLYIYNDTEKTIEIWTKNKKFLFNEDSNEKTEELYKKLTKFVNKKE
jgi:uncharacterized membrane protein